MYRDQVADSEGSDEEESLDTLLLDGGDDEDIDQDTFCWLRGRGTVSCISCM
jgi:hypothetical protein